MKIFFPRVISFLIAFGFVSLAWCNEGDGQVSGVLSSEAELMCDFVENGDYAGLVYRSIQSWHELEGIDGHFSADTILVTRWFIESQDEESHMDYKLVTKWKDAIRYIQQGHKKNAKNYSYTLIQRAMHIDGLSSLKSNVLRINAGTDKKNGVDFYVSYDVVNGVVPKVPKEYSFLTCGLNLMILGQ